MLQVDLPALGTSCEREDLDFKSDYNPKDTLEMAKDVSALANTLGGAILVGAKTNGKQLEAFPGIPRPLANNLAEAMEQAAAQRCRPTPQVATQLIELNGSTVVVANVWPSSFAPIGFSVDQNLKGARLVSHAWVFPFRVGSQTHFLQPDQFGRFESMTARRAAAQLYAIPDSDKNSLRFRWVRGLSASAGTRQEEFKYFGQFRQMDDQGLVRREVILSENVAVFLAGPRRGDGLKELQIPLDSVKTVWRDRVKNEWEIVFEGFVKEEDGRYVVLPSID